MSSKLYLEMYDNYINLIQSKSIVISLNDNNNDDNGNNSDKCNKNFLDKDENISKEFENKKRIERESERKVNRLLRGISF